MVSYDLLLVGLMIRDLRSRPSTIRSMA